MRVMVLSQYYTPEPIPKPVELAQELVRRGHSVSVLTGFPNYPSGKLYPGYRLRGLQRETIDGIPVNRSFEFPYHGKGVVGRICNYTSFMLSAPLAALLVPVCDVIYVWHPPLTIGLAAWLIARMRRVPFVYDVQDLWPESAVLAGVLREGWLVRLMRRLERFVYARADHILVVTEGARDNLIAKGVSAEKISVLPHWVDAKLFEPGSSEVRRHLRAAHGWEDRFVVMFAGNIGMLQGLDTVVCAAAEVPAGGAPLFVLIGDGSDRDRLQALAASLGVSDRIQFLDRQPAERMSDFMTAADALLVHLRRSELSRYVIPTKTLAYLATGLPIIMAMDGAAAKLVEEAGAGLLVPPEDPAKLAGAVQVLAGIPAAERAAMGRRGRDYLIVHLSCERVIPRYEAILRQVVRAGGH